MTKSTWRELVVVEATYYHKGEHPWPHRIAEAGDMWGNTEGDLIDSRWSPEEIAANADTDGDDWWADHALWWFPGVGECSEGMYPICAKIPETDERIKLLTDAVHFRLVAPYEPGSCESHDARPGLIQYDIDYIGYRDAFMPHADDMKRLCDTLRKPGHRSVTALIVFECEAGFSYIPGEPDEWDSEWHAVGLLDLKTLTIMELPQ